MKHLLKKFEFEGLFAVLALAFACVGMWGCGSGWYRGSVGIPQSAD